MSDEKELVLEVLNQLVKEFEKDIMKSGFSKEYAKQHAIQIVEGKKRAVLLGIQKGQEQAKIDLPVLLAEFMKTELCLVECPEDVLLDRATKFLKKKEGEKR